MKVLGTFPMSTLEKYLKMEKNKFRFFSYGYFGKVPKNGNLKFQVLFQWVRMNYTINGKRKVLGTFPISTLEKYLKIEK